MIYALSRAQPYCIYCIQTRVRITYMSLDRRAYAKMDKLVLSNKSSGEEAFTFLTLSPFPLLLELTAILHPNAYRSTQSNTSSPSFPTHISHSPSFPSRHFPFSIFHHIMGLPFPLCPRCSTAAAITTFLLHSIYPFSHTTPYNSASKASSIISTISHAQASTSTRHPWCSQPRVASARWPDFHSISSVLLRFLKLQGGL